MRLSWLEVNWENDGPEMGYEGTACAICKKGVFYMTASGYEICEGKSGGSIAVTIAVLLGGMALVRYFLFMFRSLVVIAKDVQKVSKLLIQFFTSHDVDQSRLYFRNPKHEYWI